jgi:hypothetical protein
MITFYYEYFYFSSASLVKQFLVISGHASENRMFTPLKTLDRILRLLIKREANLKVKDALNLRQSSRFNAATRN